MLRTIPNKDLISIYRDTCSSSYSIDELQQVFIYEGTALKDSIINTATARSFIKGEYIYNKPVTDGKIVLLSFFFLTGLRNCTTTLNKINSTVDLTVQLNTYDYVIVNNVYYKIVKAASTGNTIVVNDQVSYATSFRFAHKEDVNIINTNSIKDSIINSIEDSFGCKDCGKSDAPVDLCTDVIRYIALQNAISKNKTTDIKNLTEYFNNKYNLNVSC
jgi:hypothetical protein